MKRKYKFNTDHRTRQLGFGYIAFGGLAFAALSYFSMGGYISAWFLSVIIALIALAVMSIPRYLSLNDRSLEIHCMVELTTIPLENIHTIRPIEPSQMRYCIPVFGCYGFFGYYGYYLNLRQWDIFKVYASEWNNFVEIEDVYESRLIVSCRDAETFIKEVTTARTEFLANNSN